MHDGDRNYEDRMNRRNRRNRRNCETG